MEYETGATKRDPESGTLAQKTDQDGDRAWRVLGHNISFVPYKDVEHWIDLTP